MPVRVLEHRPLQLCISSITLAELRFGADAKASRNAQLIDTFILSVTVLPFDQAAADRFGPVANALAKAGRAHRHVRHAHRPRVVVRSDSGHEQHEALSAGRRTQDGDLGLNTRTAAEHRAAPDRRR